MNDAWKRARARYEQTQAPEELSFAVASALRAGARRRRSRAALRRGLEGTLAACACFVLLVNANPTFAKAVSDVPVLGGLARVVTVSEYTVDDREQLIDVRLPALELPENTDLEQRINTAIRARIDQVLQEAEDRARATRDAYVETGGDAADFIPVVIHVDYAIKCQNGRYLSFLLTVTETRAAAYTHVYAYNIDLEAGREITLRDVLGPDYMALANAAVEEGIAARLAADPEASFFRGENGFTSIDEDQAFYLNEAGNPVVIFEKYAIAPGYMGQPEFEVPVPRAAGAEP